MAADIKQLRIGAHVEVNGVRRAVFGLGCGRVSFLSHPVSSTAFSVLASEVNPIPITSELLVELGFKKREGGLIWSKIFDRNCYVSFSPFEDNCWSLSITPKDYRKRILVFVNNLHEAENIIWLTLHKKLIEE